MEPTKGILIWNFGSMTDADLAASQLRSAGLDCTVTSDDCGGMYPPLGSIKLMVDADAADAARDLLRQAGVGSELIRNGETMNAPGANGVRPQVYRFNSGLVIGLIVGALLHFGYTTFQQHRYGTFDYDHDGDGLPDEEVVWRNGQYVESRFDYNADGRPDAWNHYQKSVTTHGEADVNFDGKIDTWSTNSAKSFISAMRFDTDFNGVPDGTATYEHGSTKQVDWRPNGTNAVLLRQLYRHGVLDEELRDLNGDGFFDVTIKYDPFMTPVRTNNLRPTTPTP